MSLRKIVSFFLFVIATQIVAQQKTTEPPTNKEAKDNFNLGNYQSALKEYLALLKDDPQNPMYNYRAGYCYLNTYIDKSKAVKHLEAAAKSPEFEKEATFQLGKAHQQLYRFDKAIELFKQYKELMGNKPESEMAIADREIEICNNAKDLVKFPVVAEFENLGKNVNSEYADYYPLVTGDESEMFFTTRRKGTTGGFQITNDLYTSDIFRSSSKGDDWSKAKSAGVSFNTPGEDEATSMTADGKYVIIYTETEMEVGDIMISIKSGKAYQQRFPLEKGINTERMEAAGSVTGDGNTIVFSSDRAGGQGEFDIYITKRLPTGAWGEPFNLGPNVNTEFIEDFPMISDDGKVLYFCSQGHITMGGFDVFKSTYDEEKNEWSKAVNIGYPLNTPDDNMTISFTSDRRHAYLSAFREKGYGDLDIYRVTFNNIEPKYTVIKGNVYTEGAPDNSVTINVYKKGDALREFPASFTPGAGWDFVETKKKPITPGTEIAYSLIFQKDGKKIPFTIDKYPKDDPAYELVDIKSIEKKAEAAAVLTMAKSPVVTDKIILYSKSKDKIYGTYKTTSSGSYVIVAPPDVYELRIEDDGYDAHKEVVSIKDSGSAAKEIVKDVLLKKR